MSLTRKPFLPTSANVNQLQSHLESQPEQDLSIRELFRHPKQHNEGYDDALKVWSKPSTGKTHGEKKTVRFSKEGTLTRIPFPCLFTAIPSFLPAYYSLLSHSLG